MIEDRREFDVSSYIFQKTNVKYKKKNREKSKSSRDEFKNPEFQKQVTETKWRQGYSDMGLDSKYVRHFQLG